VSSILENVSRRTRLVRLARAAYRYGPVFIVEILAFWLILEAVSASGYGTDNPWPWRPWYPAASLLMVLLAMGAGEARFHLYRRVWSVASVNDAFAVGLAVIEATLLVTIINLFFPDGYRPVRILAPILAAPACVIAVGLIRLAPRLRLSGRPTANRLLVVIPDGSYYGTVKALLQQPNPEWRPVGVVTVRGAADVGQTLMGIPVLGSASTLKRWIEFSQAQGVAFVQNASLDRSEARALYHECLVAQLPVFILPAAHDWVPHGTASRLRQLSADDLVGRDEREIDLQMSAAEVRNKTVLVTGAAGSIGSELCRLLATLGPKRLILLDNNESGLFDLAEELRVNPGLDLREALVSIREREHLLRVFADERPEIVFHAAAYKHVPMLEAHPGQAVMTNVVGTMNTLRCADAAGVQKLILISTDKAASSHSVMGSTKRVCEQLVLAYRGPMKCWAVRFGNVVGSRGSVVPLFERQIQHGGPVTITHRDVTRYMMTIREAASLVLSSLAISKPSHVYMLDMGEAISIYDLANDLIRARGLRPEQDIKIVLTGLRPGERMTEELLAPDEGWRPTDHPSIREVVSPSGAKEEDLAWVVERMEVLAQEGRTDELVRVLKNTALGHPVAAEEPDAPRTFDAPRVEEPRQSRDA
jgi:FlaA1/EpsC-like NDP-sugar epimerase